jgi:hypothetical protein
MSRTIQAQPLATILTAALLWLVPQHASAQPEPCNALTQPAIQEVIAAIGRSRAQAQLDASANGITGNYAVAATYNLAYLQDAERQFQELDVWLDSNNLYTPFVNNASAAYNVHGTVREVSNLLHHARHWASISTAYHLSSSARSSITFTGEALTLMEPLGASAVACYVGFVGL